ncbi:UNVERIFIED_CONTAM: C9orf85 [Trichonephila clavipes]
MSTQRGNVARSRPQKYQNRVAFKNDKYGQTPQTKVLNAMKLTSLCSKCEGIIQWKIKFKKYKPLTVPAKCIQTCHINEWLGLEWQQAKKYETKHLVANLTSTTRAKSRLPICIKCEEKTVKSAYHNICSNCSENLNVCAKCGENFSE